MDCYYNIFDVGFDIVREVRYVVELRNDECVCFFTVESLVRGIDRAVDTALREDVFVKVGDGGFEF